MYGKEFLYQGYLEAKANLHANSASGSNVGNVEVKYKNTNVTHFISYGCGTLYGVNYGDRIFNLEGK